MDRELYQKLRWNTMYYTRLEEKIESAKSNFLQQFCRVPRADTRQTCIFAVCPKLDTRQT